MNGSFTDSGIREMFEQKDFSALNIVFLFIAAFIDREMENTKAPLQPPIHTLYPDVLSCLLYCGIDYLNHDQYFRNLGENISEMGIPTMSTLG